MDQKQLFERRVRAIAQKLAARLQVGHREAVIGFSTRFGDAHTRADGRYALATALRFLGTVGARKQVVVTTLASLTDSYLLPVGKTKQGKKRSNAVTRTQTILQDMRKHVKQEFLSYDDVRENMLLRVQAAVRKIPHQLIYVNDFSLYWAMVTEVDIACWTLVTYELPCMETTNLLIQLVPEHAGKAINLQAEKVSREAEGNEPGLDTRLDHYFSLYEPHGVQRYEGIALIEFKAPLTLDFPAWRRAMRIDVVDKDGTDLTIILDHMPIDHIDRAVSYWLGQTFHYGINRDTQEAMAIDGAEFFPLLWEPPAESSSADEHSARAMSIAHEDAAADRQATEPGARDADDEDNNTSASVRRSRQNPYLVKTYSLHRKPSDVKKHQDSGRFLSRRRERGVVPVHLSLLHLFIEGLQQIGVNVLGDEP